MAGFGWSLHGLFDYRQQLPGQRGGMVIVEVVVNAAILNEVCYLLHLRHMPLAVIVVMTMAVWGCNGGPRP